MLHAKPMIRRSAIVAAALVATFMLAAPPQADAFYGRRGVSVSVGGFGPTVRVRTGRGFSRGYNRGFYRGYSRGFARGYAGYGFYRF